MRNHNLKLLAIASAVLSSLPAVAAPTLTYNGASLYKDARNNVYFVTSYSGAEVGYNGVNVTKTPFSDACGFVQLKFSQANSSIPASISLNGTSDNFTSIPLESAKNPYKCVNGVAQWTTTPRTSAFYTSARIGQGNEFVKTVYYPSDRTGGALKQQSIAYTVNLLKTVKTTCGFIFTPGYIDFKKQSSGSLSINGSAIDLATLPLNPSPPECVSGKTLTGAATNVATFNGATLYRTAKNIYFAGLTPQSLNVVGYDAFRSQTKTADATCGAIFVTFKVAPPTIRVAGTTYTTATMPIKPINPYSICGDTMYTNAPANSLIKRNAVEFFYKGSPSAKLKIENSSVETKNIAVNACGFAIIPALNTADGFTTGDKVAINGSTPYDVMALPLATSAPKCKNGVIYTEAAP